MFRKHLAGLRVGLNVYVDTYLYAIVICEHTSMHDMYTWTHVQMYLHANLCLEVSIVLFEHTEIPAKLLDYFLRNHKININQSAVVATESSTLYSLIQPGSSP